ncbi:conserved Plasmodium protein, unknown function [Plasmodium berghei]|uniref:Uncharacterized protein n=2 Tax=Plasmodium berghei TaxID=5821 RepID=A0A509AI80_PLABA|nr:conserved protein, unknown function [Plasmodium berghei ANKA]CXI31252.1 conserved Plasmodium protein, unknown function [Plasmodium berghei]SCM20968.1 conserved Plasmodium protein, unknown function [Plasmodium berghei]SCN24393.1 conserved Plasmodium protein, unknown function [Plasmodium berghei]SCO59581.1 conserved Plasmodium protein, unknown function [Plasmodium berghei]SCO60784.1 conserved Plasmodium protein, unknown function [Plasmodium berghei]|eukprot:XP_034421086.1 conserved protein, unknown function [Plasmodium berghei ANKA]
MFVSPFGFLIALLVFFNLIDFYLSDEFERIEYNQDLTKIKYYDSPKHIDKGYLYKHVGKSLFQDLIVTVKIDKNDLSQDVISLAKKKSYIKIIGDWSKYPKHKYNMICLAFVQRKRTKGNKQQLCTDIDFTSNDSYKVCYKENNYSIKSLFLYFELSQDYFKKLFSSFSIPVIVNIDNTQINYTNNNNIKDEKPLLDLFVCYKSNDEPICCLGKVIFNSYPKGIGNNINDYNTIYTKSFLTSNWDYSIFIQAEYLTIHNRIAFFKIPHDFNKDKNKKCAPFWNYAILGAGPINKLKREPHSVITKNHIQYFFTNDNKLINYYIPYIKDSDLQINDNYAICLYSDENDFEGIELVNVHFYINLTDSIIIIFLIIFIIVFIPLIFSLTYLCAILKINNLKVKMQKLKLLNRKDEIEDRLQNELNLNQYEYP